MAALRKRAQRKEPNLEEMVKTNAQGAYEALQLYRSKANRFKSKNDVPGAISATAEGAQCLLQHGYENAGAELATLFLDLLTESNRRSDDETLKVAMEIDSKFTPSNPLRVEFLRNCVKWTTACGSKELGDATLQTRLGSCLWDIGDKHATFHFAAGEAPVALNEKIQEKYPKEEDQEKRDQALTLGVVNFLAVENLRDANELMYSYNKSLNAKNFPVKSELLTFCDYLLQTCRRDAGPLFKQLVNTYASQLDFDDSVPALLTGPIAQRLFNIQPKVNPMMSILQNLLA